MCSNPASLFLDHPAGLPAVRALLGHPAALPSKLLGEAGSLGAGDGALGAGAGGSALSGGAGGGALGSLRWSPF